MNRRQIIVMFAALVVAACYDPYAPERIERTVQQHPNRPGLYLVYYDWSSMVDNYGPGLEKTRQAVRKAMAKEAKAIWDEAMATAVPKYLQDHNIVPAQCTHGVVVVSSQRVEGGDGTTAFRCK